MDISDRKRRILAAVVRIHADSGDPVGSNVLTMFLRELAVSSATLRSEMAEMTALGLLEQPHTSAGRVPTSTGIRYYIDHLLSRNPLESKEQRAIERAVFSLDSNPEKAAESSADILASALGLGVIACSPVGEGVHIVHYELVRVGRFNVAVLGVTNVGSVVSRVCRVLGELNSEQLAKIAQCLNRHLAFISAEDISQHVGDQLGESLGILAAVAQPIFEAAKTLVAQAAEVKVFNAGIQNLLHYPELDGAMREILGLFSSDETVREILENPADDIAVYVGDELNRYGTNSLSLVVGKYRAAGARTGALGIVGPVRMNYAVVIPRLKYFCDSLSSLLTKTEAAADRKEI